MKFGTEVLERSCWLSVSFMIIGLVKLIHYVTAWMNL